MKKERIALLLLLTLCLTACGTGTAAPIEPTETPMPTMTEEQYMLAEAKFLSASSTGVEHCLNYMEIVTGAWRSLGYVQTSYAELCEALETDESLSEWKDLQEEARALMQKEHDDLEQHYLQLKNTQISGELKQETLVKDVQTRVDRSWKDYEEIYDFCMNTDDHVQKEETGEDWILKYRKDYHEMFERCTERFLVSWDKMKTLYQFEDSSLTKTEG